MAKICMNGACRATTTPLEWKKGWGLKSGGCATLCYNCGSAYENSVYCETFHLEESGWRECELCGKRVHCGCIVSKNLHDYLDFGGVGCISCAKSLETHSIRHIQIPNDDITNESGMLATNNISDPQSSFVENRTGGLDVDKRKILKLSKTMDTRELSHFPQAQRSDANISIRKVKREELAHPIGELGTGFPDVMQHSVRSSIFVKRENSKPILGLNDVYESLAEPSLSFSLTTPSDAPNSLIPSPGWVVEGREQNKTPSFQQVQRIRKIFPKPSKTAPTKGTEANNVKVSQTRVARPPAEGRGRSQLLPRYWPRITDQELQQISGDLNSTIVPLFEKVLSASDAGRIGRLVLPKACAEAYFPHISQSDGLPIRIQDIKGKEWTFQFRFWPNNNSRMYVLEGVTPCMQNMQLQAGDTVIFSRIDPGSKLVMGFRKTSNSLDMQENQTSSLPNGASHGETSHSGVNDNLPTHGGRENEDSSQRPMLITEKKRSRNIGSKSKRLLIRSEDAMELRLTWAEAQELLRPPPNVKPTIVMIEGQEVEEYDEPPVFGKRTIFTARASREQEQWAQCDSCSKWRTLPVEVLLPPKWTCLDNIWDSSRCSCSAPEEINPNELESLLRVGKEFKKRRITETPEIAQEHEPSGLDALATAAVLGENAEDTVGETSVGATTKHPRHRHGCTCIVCIQPPSGKGKHKPTCICNVCLTVKRRFKTLMLRKKKRQSERESEIARGKKLVVPHEDESEMDVAAFGRVMNPSEEDERSRDRIPKDVAETSKGQLDLNRDPNREDDVPGEATGSSMMSLVPAASLPVELYLKQNGIKNLGAGLPLQAATGGESDGRPPEEGCLSSLVGEHENAAMKD